MRILVTNDDGIDSAGLHALASAMLDFGDVTIVAPDSEYSGAGASLGTLTHGEPTATRRRLDALPDVEAWAVTGPPALCVMYAQLGTFDDAPFDLVVSGINPGQNVGWSVYHSGTIGAALTGRNRGANGVAVSLGFNGADFEGQTWPDIVASMHWDTGAAVGRAVVAGLIDSPPERPVVINVNAPSQPLPDLAGWGEAVVGTDPPRKLVSGSLAPVGDDGEETYRLRMDWGAPSELRPDTDAWLVRHDTVSVTWIGDLAGTAPEPSHRLGVATALDALF